MQRNTTVGFPFSVIGSRRGRAAAIAATCLVTAGVGCFAPAQAVAGSYTAELAAGTVSLMPTGDMVAAHGNEIAIANVPGGAGNPKSVLGWDAPSGESFAGFRYSGANFLGTASSTPYTGGFSGGFVGIGLDGADLLFPWTDDCQILVANHHWVRGGLADDGDTCSTNGNTTGWNYNNSEVSSSTGDALSENYKELTLNASCNSTHCDSGVVAEASVTNLSVLVDDPDDQVTVSGIGWLNDAASSVGWFQTESGGPTLQFTASDPGGVCYSDVAYTSSNGSSGNSGDLSPVPTTVTPTPVIGREFASVEPCVTSASPSYALPNTLASGTYQLTVQTENAGAYEGAGFSGSGASNGGTKTLNVDNTVPSVSISDATNSPTAAVQVTTGPSGLASLTCYDDGVSVSPTWASGAVTGQTSNAGGTLSSEWSVPTGGSVNDVSCVATNGDLNGALSNPVATFSDPRYTPGTWTTATASDPQVVTVTPSAGATLGYCYVNSNRVTPQGADGDEIYVNSSGVSTIMCYAKSGVDGSSLSESSYQILVDDQQPTVAYTGQTATDASNGTWIAGAPTVSMVGEELDANGENNLLSGIRSITCTVNGADSQTLDPSAASGYAASFRLTENGVDTVTCTPTSGAGVVGVPMTEVVKVDNPSAIGGGGDLTGYGSSVLIDDGNDPYSSGPSEHTWYHSEQQVTITATNTGGGSPISSIACTGATLAGGQTAGNWTNNSGGATEQQTIVVSAPGGDLSCIATDSAGNTYPLGSYDFQIDQTAPTGEFVAQHSWPEPDDLQLSVSDPGGTLASGVALVRVYAQPDVGGPPDDLGLARYDAATGNYEVAVDDGVMDSGSYTFYANVSDVAGNQGQITAGPNGATETLSLPLRSATAISTASGDTSGVQASAVPLSIAAGAGVVYAAVSPAVIDANLAVARERQLSSAEPRTVLAAARAFAHAAVHVSTVKAQFGAAIELSGRLRVGRQTLSSRRLTVWRVIAGTRVPSEVATSRTNGVGRYKVHVDGGPSATYYVVYSGTSHLRAVAAEIRTAVEGDVRIEMGVLRAGSTVVLRGRILGGHIPSGGLNVAVRYAIVGYTGWGTFETGHAGADGRFAISFPVGIRDSGLTYLLRAKVLSSGGWPYRGAFSNVLRRHVS